MTSGSSPSSRVAAVEPPVTFTPLVAAWTVALVGTVPIFRILPFTNQWVVAAMGLLVVTALLGIVRRPVVHALWPVCALLTALGAWTSAGNALDTRAHWIIGSQLFLWFALGPFAARGLLQLDPRIIRWSAIGLVLIQTISATAAIVQVAFGATILGQGALFGRAPGLAGHPNILGLMAGISVVLCAEEAHRCGRWRWVAIAVAVVNMGGLLACGSISALFALLLGLVTFVVVKRIRPSTVAWATGGLLLLGWSTAALIANTGSGISVTDRVLQVTGQTSAVGTLDTRQQTIGFAWEQIQLDPWYGVGLDDFSGGTYNGATVTHDVLVRAWFQGGLGLGLAFLLLFAALTYLVLRSLVKATNASSAAVIVVVGGFSLTAASFQQGYFWVPILGAVCIYSTRPHAPRIAAAPDPHD